MVPSKLFKSVQTFAYLKNPMKAGREFVEFVFEPKFLRRRQIRFELVQSGLNQLAEGEEFVRVLIGHVFLFRVLETSFLFDLKRFYKFFGNYQDRR